MMEFRNTARGVLFAGFLGLAGCTTTLTHPYKGQQEFYADMAFCESQGRSGGGNYQVMPSNDAFTSGWNQSSAIAAAGASKRITENCMYGKGWRPAGDDSGVSGPREFTQDEQREHAESAAYAERKALEAERKQLERQREELEYQKFEMEIRKQVPDYDELMSDENIAALNAFVDSQKPSLRRAYRLTIESGTAEEVVDLLNEFKAYKAASNSN